MTVINVGIIGCGEIAQVVHIPTLVFLASKFRITTLCDVSQDSLAHCVAKVPGTNPPKTTTSPAELCASPDVDLVLVINSDEYHAEHGILALQNDKHVLIEKPVALNDRDADALIEAERKSKGKVMVGYMRRYAAVFADAVREIGGMEKILYVRVRDIIGANATFVDQSGTFPRKFSDFPPEDAADKQARATEMVSQAFLEAGVTHEQVPATMWRVLGGLGTHDLSLMREAIGTPIKVLGASYQWPFWSALLQYDGFTVVYESGVDSIPRFDAHLEVYGGHKSVRVKYDTPYVKGLPVTMRLQENINGEFHETSVRKTYEDPYTLEFKEIYDAMVNGKPVKTTVEDAKQDTAIFKMLVRAVAKNTG